MNAFNLLLILLLSVAILDAQFQPRTSPRRPLFRPMTRNSVGRRGPVPPSRFNAQPPTSKSIRSPGFKPPAGIAKKLNEATDFRALARVLLKQ